MLPDAIPQRSRPCMFAPHTQTQKGSDKGSGVGCFPNTVRSNKWVYQNESSVPGFRNYDREKYHMK